MARFQVDLHGLVSLLSKSLYSSPRVFVRELLQNGVDAVTERRTLDPDHAGRVEIDVAADGLVRFADNGIGLTEDEVVGLLATIGSSSKRDEFDFQRAGLLGQFGIGLLSCFLVSDDIEVITRSARSVDAPTVRWVGHGDGTYDISTHDNGFADEPRPVPGTTVTLRPRAGESWLAAGLLRELATRYGALLPIEVELVDHRADPPERVPVAPRFAPWELDADSAAAWCHRHFGFLPAAAIPLDVPIAGVRGVAFVQPNESNPTQPNRPRVYLRRMLLGESVPGLLPDWAYFARAVVDVGALNPTASREALQDDDLLASTRAELGHQLRDWFVRTAARDPELLQWVVITHGLALRAAAVHDDELLGLVRDWTLWESSTGDTTLARLLATDRTIRYVASNDEFESIARVARAQEFTVLNAGHVYELEVLHRLAETDASITLHRVTSSDVFDRLAGAVDLPGADRLARRVRAALPDAFCDVAVRVFEPADTPALYLPDSADDARDVARTTHAGAQQSDVFADLVGAAPDLEPVSRALLVLNAANPAVTRLATVAADEVVDAVAQLLYAVAVQAAGVRDRTLGRGLLSSALVHLIERTD